jgi:hypothetical protein
MPSAQLLPLFSIGYLPNPRAERLHELKNAVEFLVRQRHSSGTHKCHVRTHLPRRVTSGVLPELLIAAQPEYLGHLLAGRIATALELRQIFCRWFAELDWHVFWVRGQGACES